MPVHRLNDKATLNNDCVSESHRKRVTGIVLMAKDQENLAASRALEKQLKSTSLASSQQQVEQRSLVCFW